MSASRIVLYSYFRSSCSYRVRIALNFKGIAYEHRAVNIAKGEQWSEEFLRLSPCAEVPVLVDEGRALAHSTAILEYLEETVQGQPLLPTDPVARARVRGLVDALAAGIQPLQNLKVLKHVGDGSTEWARHWIESGFKAVERTLQDTHGQYCVGDDVTLADVCLVPQVFNARRFQVDIAAYPLIKKISDRLSELKPFRDAHPLLQPDCPDELKTQVE